MSTRTLSPADRAAIDNMHRLFNQELDARVLADLTGTPVSSWRARVKAWWANKSRRIVETTGEVQP